MKKVNEQGSARESADLDLVWRFTVLPNRYAGREVVVRWAAGQWSHWRAVPPKEAKALGMPIDASIQRYGSVLGMPESGDWIDLYVKDDLVDRVLDWGEQPAVWSTVFGERADEKHWGIELLEVFDVEPVEEGDG